jgi:hypothetical protein
LAKDIAVSISENTTIHVKMTSETLITKNNDVKVNPKIVNIHTNLPLVFKYKDNSVITIGNVRKNDGDIATDTLSMGLNTDATIALSRLLTNLVFDDWQPKGSKNNEMPDIEIEYLNAKLRANQEVVVSPNIKIGTDETGGSFEVFNVEVSKGVWISGRFNIDVGISKIVHENKFLLSNVYNGRLIASGEVKGELNSGIRLNIAEGLISSEAGSFITYSPVLNANSEKSSVGFDEAFEVSTLNHRVAYSTEEII